jgi:hypothetical protein
MRTEARFPTVDPDAGHYESFYLKTASPEGGRAVWLRHTTHQRPGEEASASIWLTLFDREKPGPRAIKATYGPDQVSAPTGAFIEVGDAIMEPGRAHGSIDTDDTQAGWELSFTDDAPPFRHLPREAFYRRRLPRTKLESPYPYTRFSGSVSLGSERLELDAWPGMVGHNWGSEHAERWVWIQAADLGGRQGDFLDVAAGRVKVGPFTTPWIANGLLVLEGQEYRLGGLGHAYGTEIDAVPGSCTFTLPGKNVNVKGTVSSDLKDFVAWVYADPVGPEHNVINCSAADIELKIERPASKHAKVGAEGAAAYELGMRESDHGIPLQPYADG